MIDSILLDSGRRRQYPAGAMLMAEGDPGGVVLTIVTGQAQIVVGDAGQVGARVVATRGPGDLVGELSAFDGLPRSATVIATTDVEVSALSSSALIDALSALDPAAIAVLRSSARSVRAATDADAISAGGAPAAVIAAWLLDRQASQHDGQPIVEFDASEFAAALSISQESLSRALSYLAAIGALILDRGRVVILDADILCRL
jgi:CRP/FNR family transcriptional regulator, cyclic AMP receptor protein